MQFSFTGRVVEWRGPAPFYYVVVPEQESTEIAELSASVSYGWGAVPVEARIGTADLSTSLFPKDGRYLLPLRAAVRTAQGIDVDDEVAVQMRLGRG